MARVLERLEVRSGPTGSTDTSVVDIIPDVISAVTSQEANGRESYTVQIPLLSTAWSNLVERQVLKNIMSDGTVDSEWRIMSLKSKRTPGQLNGTINCESIKYDLNNTLVSRTEANGDVNNYFELYGLTPTEHLGVILADAPSHFSAGTIATSAPLDIVYDWDNALSASAEIASQANLELGVRLTSTGYKVDMPVSIGSTASKVYIRYSRNLLAVGRDSDARTNQGTRVYPRGGGDVGDRLKISEAAWLVTATSTVTATLSTADGRPIEFDNQLNNLWVEEPGGTRKQVTDSTTGQVITVAAGHGISTGERVKFRTSSGGNQLTYLENPAEVITYGEVQRVLDRQDIPLVDNLVENPFFTGTYTAGVPTNWSTVGSPTFAENTDANFRRYGNKSLHITATSSGQGVVSDSITITPSSASPFFTVEAALWVVSGSVQMELVELSSTTNNKFPPVESERAKTTVVGQWVDNLAVAGIDLNEVPSTALKLQVLALSTGGAEWYMDAAQVTQTAGGAEVFNDGRASNALWIAGNKFLSVNAVPRVTFDVKVDDLERLHPAEFGNAKFVVGGTVQVVDSDMGLDFETRTIELRRDLLHPGNSQLTLSNRPEDLSGLGIPGPRAKILRQKSEPRRVITSAFDEVSATIEDDGTDLTWTLRFTFVGGITSTEHQLNNTFFRDGTLIDQDAAVSIDASQPHVYTSTGLGGSTSTPLYWVTMAVVSKTSAQVVGATADVYPVSAASIVSTTLFPDGDKSVGAWGASPLWSKVDADDANAIDTQGNSLDSCPSQTSLECEVTLGNPSGPPGTSATQEARLQGKGRKIGSDSTGGCVDITWLLKQGTTTVVSTGIADIGSTYATINRLLTDAEYDAITNFNNLRIEIQGDVGFESEGSPDVDADCNYAWLVLAAK